MIVEIEWNDEDALTFPLCISSRTDEEHGEKYLGNTVSVARGNIVLCDHGLTEINAPIPDTVPEPTISVQRRAAIRARRPSRLRPPRYGPVLNDQPLTFAAPFDVTSAASAMPWDETAIPAISLSSLLNTDTATMVAETRSPQQRTNAIEFAVEVDTDGVAYLRFGDDLLGKRPETATQFTATYRVGNGVAGNVGAESLAHIVSDSKRFSWFEIHCLRREVWIRRRYRMFASARLPHSDAGARRHRSRLRGRDATRWARATRGCNVSLDRQLAHGFPHGGPSRGFARR